MIEPSDHQCVGSRDASSNAGEVLANEYALAGTGRASFTWPCTPTGPCVGVRGPSPNGDVCAVQHGAGLAVPPVYPPKVDH